MTPDDEAVIVPMVYGFYPVSYTHLFLGKDKSEYFCFIFEKDFIFRPP